MNEVTRLGQMLVNAGTIDEAGLEKALQLQRESGSDRLGALLIRLGLISESTLLSALSEQLHIPVFVVESKPGVAANIAQFHRDRGVSRALAQRLEFLVVPAIEDDGPLVISRDPLDSELQEYLVGRLFPDTAFSCALVAQRDFERLLTEVYRVGAESAGEQDLRRLAEDAPVVELVNAMLARANDKAASDIHVEPLEYGFSVRYRVDGHLQFVEHYPRDRFDAVVSRIKLISGLDIAERRLTQDGRFSSRAAGVETDVRVSVIPSVFGESIVMRLLPVSQEKRFSLEGVGFEPDHLATFQQWMSLPDGIVLVTGPTGSGKSTTLYAALSACDSARQRILTVEDPVEYKIDGVTQFQVNADIGFTFAAALRAILRHDPDVVMIGEIRDIDTARIAVQASLTGHLVFSTLHTNDTPTAFLRLVDLGVEQFLVGATVRGVLAQRLVRRLCPVCSRPMSSTERATIPAQARAFLERHGVRPADWSFRQPVGCDACDGTGYRGRTAVYELLPATDALRAALSQQSAGHQDLLRSLGADFRTLGEDGLLKAARGLTSLAEVMAVAGAAYLPEGSGDA
ncbi:GspE/PulE family protein [Uliginosibacterium sp. sgz301328]|uniref:GspE/PulE family protein n=1 Tax=Uliginosibacterium sp. sgz301328 TaxID=3243764 RepID=UPI00359D8E1C